MFDTIAGLPVHPLVVHAAVVLWPIGVIGLLVMVFAPRLRDAVGWPTMVLLVVGALTIYVSKESGEKLAHRIGTPQEHAGKAEVLTLVALGTLLLSIAWWVLERRAKARARTAPAAPASDELPTRGATRAQLREANRARAATQTEERSKGLWLLGTAAATAGLVSLVFSVLVGHTGAQAAWGDRMAADPAPSGASTSSPGHAGGAYTMAQVREHSTKDSCWVAIDGMAYDLTDWVGKHPGGADKVAALCGTDGTSAFAAQHGDDGTTGRPQQILKRYALGQVSG